ncbi:MAG TPA: hypothetical protein VMV12_03085 [Candidatus Micrarchaeaceae archaeon]|nr:hypothetical protein [Candidatus Micrarchaeaceae archaeon]
MNRELSPRRPGIGPRLLDLDRVAASAERLLRATSGRAWWVAAAGTLTAGGAAAGLHAPIAGAWFWQLADGELIRHYGLVGTARFLAQSGAPLDLRSWLADLGLAFIYRGGGLTGLAITGAVAGMAVGVCLWLAIRSTGRAHPLVAMVAGGVCLLALAPVLTDLSAELLAVLIAGLIPILTLATRRGWAGKLALVGLVILWSNVQADAAVGLMLIWVWLVVAHWDARQPGRPAAPSWWLIPATGLALLLSPRGLGAIAELPLSLGMQGEHPLLVAWSSIDFHPWSARVSELAAVMLLFSYWLAGSRLRRVDAYLGLATAVLALLWSNYLPWFLVVAAVQGSWYLSVAGLRPGAASSRAVGRGKGRGATGSRAKITAAIPPLIALVVLGSGLGALTRGSGVSGQTAAHLPVRAAHWLADHPAAGSWFTTPLFGDYLSSQFPADHHLLCVDDPVPLAGTGLGRCEQLTVLNAGALGTLQALHPRLAVLPRAAPAATFLRAEGWVIRYRDPTTVILAPRHL